MTKKTEEEKSLGLTVVLTSAESDPANWVPMYDTGSFNGGHSERPLGPNHRPAYWQNDKAGLQSKTMPECCSGVYDEYGFKVTKATK